MRKSGTVSAPAKQQEPVRVMTAAVAEKSIQKSDLIPTPTIMTHSSPSHPTEARDAQPVMPVSSASSRSANLVENEPGVVNYPHIIGRDGNFCLDAHGNAATWDQLKNGRTTNKALFKNREKIGREAAFIDRDLILFDPEFFGISPMEAAYMDPLQRHLLMSVQTTMENAGIAQLPSSTGIFIGNSTADFVSRMMVTMKEINGYYGAGTNVSALAGRIAHWLKAEGPVVTVDTACSSSFTALIAACDALRDGKCDYAIVGAATLILLEHGTEVLTRAGMMSSDFACKVMDASANGYLRGEAAASILLYKDSSLGGAAIKAWALGHNGTSSALAAPNGKRQEKLMAAVCQTSLTWREAHMTGTSLGDPIETGAIARVGGGAEVRVSSIKSAVGHSEAVAGFASLLAVLSQLDADYYLPQLHYACRNQKMPDAVRFDTIGCDGVQETQLTVNSFGFTGTNTVILLEREQKQDRLKSTGRPVLIPISVHDLALLEEHLQQVECFLAASALPLDAIAATLQHGRAHRRHRAAMVVDHRRRVVYRGKALKKPQPLALDISGSGLDKVANRLKKCFHFEEGKDAAASIAGLITKLGLKIQMCSSDPSLVADGFSPFSSMPENVHIVDASTLTPFEVLSLVADAYVAKTSIDWSVLSPKPPRRTAFPIIPSAMNLRPFWPELRDDLEPELYPEYEIVLEAKDVTPGEQRVWCGERLAGADPLPPFVAHSKTASVLLMYPKGVKESVRLVDIALRIIEVWKEVERHGGLVVVARRNDGSQHLQVSALLRSLASESRGVSYKVIGYDTVDEVASELRDVALNEVVVFKEGVRHVQRLSPIPKAAAAARTPLGRVLISGGSGGIGRSILQHLRPAESIVLSRSGAAVDGTTKTVKGDCANKADLAGLEKEQVDRVFHCAGSVANALRHSQTDALMLTVLMPKVEGFANLVAAAAGAVGVDAMSSSAVVLGSAGQTNYAFANGWMADAAEAAGHRAVHWGPWRDAGMLAADELESIRRQIEEGGWKMMEAKRAVRHVASADRRSRLVMDADWSKILARQPHLAPFLERICAAPAAAAASSTASSAAPNPVQQAAAAAASDESVEEIIARVSGLTTIERDLGFMTMGIDSLMIEDIRNQIRLAHGVDLSVADIYDNSTLERLEKYVDSKRVLSATMEMKKVEEAVEERSDGKEEIAIIGYSGAFSGSRSVEEFWDRLYRGDECIWRGEKQDDDEENIVRAGGIVEGIDEFDNAFFHITKEDAARIEPQIRTFVQHAYAALERSGYVKDRSSIRTGVWAGAEPSEYSNGDGEARGTLGRLYAMNQKDFVAAWTAHLLDLRGSATGVYTACSSALLAMDQACSALKEGKVDLALAGAVSLQLPDLAFYEYQPGNVLSPDGKCCPFDEHARGIVRGSAVACLVMKRLSEALRDGDTIHAVVKAIGVSNDGVEKASFMAPNRRGMRDCMEDALRQCEDDVIDSIKFVECHGTGTSVGDEMELSALRDVYRTPINIGSVKANIGHCFAGAGLAGVVKGMAILKRREIPPQINFTRFHPRFGNTKTLKVTTKGEEIADERFHVAVSSFGIGGTNGHIVLGPSPKQRDTTQEPPPSPSRVYILPVSARTEEACRRLCARLADHLDQGADLATVASTLQRRRDVFKHRFAIVARDVDEAIRRLRNVDNVISAGADFGNDALAFYFAPQGVQYPDMEKATLELAPVFERTLEKLSSIVREKISLDLYREMYPREGEESRIKDADLAQIAIFSICQAITQQLAGFGVEADRCIGHSVGEYAAMAYGEAATPAELLQLLIARGRLVATTPNARMLAVRGELPPLPEDIEISAHLSENMICIVGPPASIEDFTSTLLSAGLEWKELETAHGFHSYMLEPILPQFDRELRQIRFKRLRKTLISNVDGKSRREITPNYCKTHMRCAIRIDKCVNALKTDKKTRAVLQIGPSGILENLLANSGVVVVNTCDSKRNHERFPNRSQLFEALAQLWCHGHRLNFGAINPADAFDESMPTYAFDQVRCWKERKSSSTIEAVNRVFSQGWAPLSLKPTVIDGKRVLIFVNGEPEVELKELLLDLEKKHCKVEVARKLNDDAIKNSSDFKPDLALFVIQKATSLDDTFFASFAIRRHVLAARPVPFVIVDLEVTPLSSTVIGSLREQHLLAPGMNVYVENSLRAPLLPLVEKLASGAPADQLMVLPGGKLMQLAYSETSAAAADEMRLHGRVLMMGGSGAIGKSLVREVLHRVKEGTTVVIASRNATSKHPADLAALAAERGHRLEAVDVDVLDETQVFELIARLKDLSTVVNVVGLPPVENLDKPRSEVLKVLQSKITSTENVILALEKSQKRLENLVLISSLSALLGLQGTEEYAAANGYLDSLASTLSGLVDNVVSIQWPAWKDGGMAAETTSPISSLLNDGAITHVEGRRLFREALKYRCVVAVAKMHPMQLKNEIGRRLRGADDVDVEGASDDVMTPAEIVRDIWSTILSAGEVKDGDNFFEIGGNSLNALQISWAVNKRLRCSSRVNLLFEFPVFADFVSEVMKEANKGDDGIKILDKTSKLPLTYAQDNMFLLKQLERGTHYNIVFSTEQYGEMDERAMRAAIMAVVARQHSMRSVFLQSGLDEPSQSVFSLTECYQLIDYKEMSEDEYQQLVASELAWEFDLAQIPLRIISTKVGDRYSVIFSQYHIITDGWSMTILARELTAAYHHFIGRGERLPPLQVSIADVAGWQRSESNVASLKADVEALKTRLLGKRATRILPSKARPLKMTKNCDKVSVMLPKEVTARADALAAKEKSTAYAVYLSYFLKTLRAWSEEEELDDIVIGCPVSGRSRPEMNDLVGYFLNNSIIDVEVKPEEEVESVLKKVRQCTTENRRFERIPYQHLVAALDTRESREELPFYIYFNFRNDLDFPKIEIHGLHSEVKQLSMARIFETSVTLDETPEGMRILIEYNTDVFTPESMQRFLDDYATSLSGDARQPVPVTGSRLEFPAQTLIQLIRQQVALTPDAPALIGSGDPATYSQLWDAASPAAARLQDDWFAACGECLRADDIVPMSTAPNEVFIPMLAALISGAAYAPLDPKWPEARIEGVREAVNAPFILDKEWIESVNCKIEIRMRSFPEDLLYIIHTSGSTGKPKGVCISNTNLTLFTAEATRQTLTRFHVDLLQSVNSAFDVSKFNMFTTFTNGASLHRPRALTTTVDEAAEIGAENLFVNGAVFHSLSDKDAAKLRSVSRVIVGGELVQDNAIMRMIDNGIEFIIIWGPSETTIWNTAYRSKIDQSGLVLGYIMPNEGIALTETNRNLERGHVGEALQTGDKIGRGYLHNAQPGKFLPNPHRTKEDILLERNSIAYRSGDRLRMKEGLLNYVGRGDKQTKVGRIRGQRIELREIEASIIAAAPAITAAFVLKVEERLVAFIMAPDTTVTLTLLSALRSTLPAFMIPSEVVLIEKVPRTLNGKVDTAALAALVDVAVEKEVVVYDEGSTLARLQKVWGKILQKSSFHPSDDFFSSGGHSLLIFHFRATVEEEFGVSLDLVDLIDTRGPVAAAAANADEVAYRDVITPIRESSEASHNIYAIHAIGGTIIPYFGFVKVFPAKFNLYGIEYREEYPGETIEDLGAFYAKNIFAHASSTPFFVMGHSMGGHLSREVALLLNLPFIVSLDTWYARPGLLRLDVIESFLKDAFAILPNPDALVKRGLKLGRLLRDYDPKKGSSVKIYLLKAERLGRSALQGVLRNDVTEDMVRAMLYNGLEDLSDHEIDVVTVPGDHEGMLSARNLALYAKELARPFLENM
ncbi:hypothetical protein PMAYCL1PPCAC_03875 [Pristionchus mayeri]|uniref:Fatty acid synthase n=1 Tax=Pristionchus mayeri TaxID=1317129 RepID=A0AAN5C7J4_9BILA|nr:hypothetical protein PMAYCL1PPCAC_03875 [Pristionchus mayeri]